MQGKLSRGKVVLYTTSTPATRHQKTAIRNIIALLAAKKVVYEEVDLAEEPTRRTGMLSDSGGKSALPQLHVNGKYLGDAADTLGRPATCEAVAGLLRKQAAPPALAPLLQDLEAAGGRGCVALIHSTLQRLEAGDGVGADASAQIVQEAAWEKLHTGSWQDVAPAWPGPGDDRPAKRLRGNTATAGDSRGQDAARGVKVVDTRVGAAPVVITGAMDHWPALARWRRPAYLLAAAGPRTVPVELGAHYLAPGWGQALMPFSQFLAAHLLGGAARGAGGSAGPGGGGAAEAGGGAARRGYLAQHDLFAQVPELARDISTPDYCAATGELCAVNAWLGPAGTVTPLHTDPHHNLLAQAVGVKYVRLYPPSAAAVLCPFREGLTTNSSQVDLDAPGAAQRWPGLAQAPLVDCLLRPGQMLYVPPGWWHYVRALTTSFSVSFWWGLSDADQD
ncbi:hypothetical protein WJX81_008092 [Elliptochloris bilobata]|uniref:JmjC domain-containing protein n=1 Tax=Elliptochloris bilobata TaxID=381761 RepID=A0AAW1SGP5_9CHLO